MKIFFSDPVIGFQDGMNIYIKKI